MQGCHDKKKNIQDYCVQPSFVCSSIISPRFEGIIIVRNGGSYGAVSANWSISRNSSDRSPVSDDLEPVEGTVRFAASQVTAVIPMNIVADDLPEEAEAFLLKLLPNTVTGNAEVDEPMEVSLKDIFSNLNFLIASTFYVFIYSSSVLL